MFSFCNGTTTSWTPSCKFPYVPVLDEAGCRWALVSLGSSRLCPWPGSDSTTLSSDKILNWLTETRKPITKGSTEGSSNSLTIQGCMGTDWPAWSGFGSVFLGPVVAAIIFCSSLTCLTFSQISLPKVWTALLLSLNSYFNNNARCPDCPLWAYRLAVTESIFSYIPNNKSSTFTRKEFNFCKFCWNCCLKFRFHWSRLALVILVCILTLAYPPNSRCYCLDGDEELGAFGNVVCMLGCLFVGGCDISIQISLQIFQPLTNATSCFSKSSLFSTQMALHSRSEVCYLVFKFGLDHSRRSSSSPQIDFGGFIIHVACMHAALIWPSRLLRAPAHSISYLQLNHHLQHLLHSIIDVPTWQSH